MAKLVSQKIKFNYKGISGIVILTSFQRKQSGQLNLISFLLLTHK